MAETLAIIHSVLSTGSGFSSLVEAVSGQWFVLKLSGAGPGRRALATEYVALKLAKRMGLNVPDVDTIEVPRDFPWQTGTDEFYEAVQRSAGVNLAVAFIADARDLKAADLAELPDAFLARLAAVDALLQNVDRTAANPNILRDRNGAHWAIDFGACLLIERLARGATEPRRDLPPNHFLSRDARLSFSVRAAAAAADASFVGAVVAGLPKPWLADLGLSHAALLHGVMRYLETLRAD